MGMKQWSAADIERGLKVRIGIGPNYAMVLQASWSPGDNIDSFVLVFRSAGVYRPGTMNAAQVAAFLTRHGYVPC